MHLPVAQTGTVPLPRVFSVDAERRLALSVVKCPAARHQPSAAAPPDRFVEPPWDAPLDTAVALAAIPKDAEISGMFTAPLVTGTKRVVAEQEGARERYVAFRFYPLREHAAWLLDVASAKQL